MVECFVFLRPLGLRLRLQTGMRGAWGKPLGLAARVKIGQVLMSVRTKDENQATVVEAFRRAKFKYPGVQKIIVSNKWGFTKFTHEVGS